MLHKVSKKDFNDLYSKLKSEVTIGHKIQPIHLDCTGFDRQNVRLACELLSKTVSLMFRHYFPNNLAKKSLSELIKLVDMVFNLLTAKDLDNTDFVRSALGGQHLEKQLDLLNEFKDLISRTKFHGKVRFPTGLIISVQAHIELQQVLQNEYNIPQLLTNHTTQEITSLIISTHVVAILARPWLS